MFLYHLLSEEELYDFEEKVSLPSYDEIKNEFTEEIDHFFLNQILNDLNNNFKFNNFNAPLIFHIAKEKRYKVFKLIVRIETINLNQKIKGGIDIYDFILQNKDLKLFKILMKSPNSTLRKNNDSFYILKNVLNFKNPEFFKIALRKTANYEIPFNIIELIYNKKDKTFQEIFELNRNNNLLIYSPFFSNSKKDK